MGITELPFGFPGKVYRSPMPFGYFDIDGTVYSEYREAGIDVIVLLNGESEYKESTGRDLKKIYIDDGYHVLHLPIRDFSVPSLADFEPVIEKAIELAKGGSNVAVHCHAGVGRAGLFLGVMAKRELGVSGQEAIRWVRSYLPGAIQGELQERFVIDN